MDSFIEKWKDIFRRFSGKGVYPNELAFLLDNPIRRLIIKTEILADNLHLKSNSVVLEIGCGPGYFSTEIANRIPLGRLIMFDIQKEMLLKAQTKIRSKEIINAFPINGDATSLPFITSKFDVVFLVTVLGEVSNPEECMFSISRVLKVNGLLSITEMNGDPDLLTQEELSSLASKAGFTFEETYSTSRGFTLNFRKVK
jgi:ubiquinone/menaquinone biosynthesis C-methylase UbiE